MESVSVGLDIGSSAVRAAEIEVSSGGTTLRRYAQVGLPRGYVVDGEVANVVGVAEALRRLWLEGGFRSRKVVLGVSGPRVFVRQADLPVMSGEDLRSSLRFNGQELVPLPLDEASFDVGVLDQNGQDGTMRVLLIAAHRDALRSYTEVLHAAGLTPIAMDPTGLALLRAVPATTGSSEGLEVVVSIGAELTTIGVRHQGVPRFIRTLTTGGTKLTASIADSAQLEMAVAERVKRGGIPDAGPQMAQIRKAFANEVRDLGEDVRATLDFFAAQANDGTVERLLITGGASQTEGVAAAVGGSLPVDVLRVPPFAGLDTRSLGLSADELDRASAGATTAIGLAMWPYEAPLIRLSVLPEEVEAARKARRTIKVAALGVVSVAAVLGVGGYLRLQQVSAAKHQEADAQHQVQSLTAEVNRLETATLPHGQMLSRAGMVKNALQGDIDWVSVLSKVADGMPAGLHLTSFAGQRTISSGSASTASDDGPGTVSFSVSGNGDSSTAAAWLTALQSDPDFKSSWVSGITVGSGKVTFTSAADLTSSAESGRAEEVQP